MKFAYPVIFTESGKDYISYIPDFDMYSQGSSLAEAIEMARDEIGLLGIDCIDNGEELPTPSNLKEIQALHPNDIVTLVDIDFDEYRKANDTKSVRRNVTLPAWLDYEATKSKINVSAVLKDALISALNLTPRYK